MSGELRGSDIKPEALKVEFDLYEAGFDPWVDGVQPGFWVQYEAWGTCAVLWLPKDAGQKYQVVDDLYAPEDRLEANKMNRAYWSHLRELAEEEARQAYQRKSS